jgi:hypothetical protein
VCIELQLQEDAQHVLVNTNFKINTKVMAPKNRNLGLRDTTGL